MIFNRMDWVKKRFHLVWESPFMHDGMNQQSAEAFWWKGISIIRAHEVASEIFWKTEEKARKMESFGCMSQGTESTGFHSHSQLQIKATGEWEEVFATKVPYVR